MAILLDTEETNINHDDSVNSLDDEEKNFFNYCRKRACDSTQKHLLYIIFTSSNQNDLPGVFPYHLVGLEPEDACNLIRKGLIANNFTDQDVEELAKILNYFPLPLKQAIAYINNQQKNERTCVIQSFLEELHKKTNNLNDQDIGKRTLNDTLNDTLSVIIDAIKQDTNGQYAIQLLHLLSYLYVDKIDAKLFLPLFENDSKKNKEAFLLLQKYAIISKIGETTCYRSHRLVQEVVRRMFNDKKGDILEQAGKCLFPKLFQLYLGKIEHYADAILEAMEHNFNLAINYNIQAAQLYDALMKS